MKIKLKDKIESAHQWLDEDGKLKRAIIRGEQGETLDSEKIGVGDPERALQKLVKLGLAE